MVQRVRRKRTMAGAERRAHQLRWIARVIYQQGWWAPNRLNKAADELELFAKVAEAARAFITAKVADRNRAEVRLWESLNELNKKTRMRRPGGTYT